MTPDIYTYRNEEPATSVEGGALFGKRVVIQPNMSVRGWPTDAGSKALEGFISLEDATVVSRIRKAGARLVGSARMGELGFGLAGDTSADVLARGDADIALITDTMGEARIAACRAGLFGFKPSFGTVSRFGLIGLAPSMETYGIAARELKDIATVMTVISGRDENDFSMPDETPPDFSAVPDLSEPTGAVGVLRGYPDFFDKKETEEFAAALGVFDKAGIMMRDVSLAQRDLFRTVHNVVASVEASSSAGKYDGVRYGHRSPAGKNWNDMYLNTRKESFGTLIKTYLFQGAYFQFENYSAFENACRIRRRLVNDATALFDGAGFLALPVGQEGHDAAKAATIDDVYRAFSMTLPFNVTGQPALYVPPSALGTPMRAGFQLAGPRLSDARLLSVAMRLASEPIRSNAI